MPQSLANVLIHLVFSTKERRLWLQHVELRNEMHAYLAGVSKQLDCVPIIVGGVDDHVHILARQARTISLAEWVKELKRISSAWAKDRDPQWRLFHWQAGYGAFSVSQSQAPRVERYIEMQSEHHRRFTYQDELRLLLQRHGVDYDERYVWD